MELVTIDALFIWTYSVLFLPINGDGERWFSQVLFVTGIQTECTNLRFFWTSFCPCFFFSLFSLYLKPHHLCKLWNHAQRKAKNRGTKKRMNVIYQSKISLEQSANILEKIQLCVFPINFINHSPWLLVERSDTQVPKLITLYYYLKYDYIVQT